MTATILIALAALFLLAATFGLPSLGGVNTQPLGLALGAIALLAMRLNLP